MTSELAGVAEHDVLCIEESTDPKRAAIFAFARKVSREPASITREDVDSLRPYLKDAQIVELVFAVCRYNTMNRLADAFGVPLEKENVFAPPPKTKKKGGAGGTQKKAAIAPDAGSGPPDGPRGSVVAAGKGRIVIISVGSKDGVRVGDLFGLSRGAAYVGTIKMTWTDTDSAVGVFDVDNPGSAAPPQPGDTAFGMR